MKNRVIKLYFIIFFCLSSVLFFIPIFIPLSLLYYTYYTVFFVTLIIVLKNYKSYYNNTFAVPIFLLLIAIIISACSAIFSWGQGILNSFKAISLYLTYIIFFPLVIWKLRIQDIEKIIVFLGVLYIIVFIISFIFYPSPVFGDIESVSIDRGFQRLRLGGRGFLFLFSFYALGRFLIRKYFWWLIIYLVTMVAIIMLLTRSIMFVSIIVSTLFILQKANFYKKIITILFIAFFLFFITKMNFFKLMLEQTKVETTNVKDNIRILSAYYYINNFSPDIFSRIFGNGESSEGSIYSRYVYNLEEEVGFYQSDIGYIGLYSKFGLLAIIAYLILIYRSFKISVPDEYLYCKYFLYFIFLISIIIDAPFNPSFIPSIVLAAYVLHSKDLSRTDTNERSVQET